ncbi:DUF6160 family protein [Hydrocarboniclastica marina]|uniref:DUF6160 domain-containing protein n=1 Tax=Hydrocarboniclastica marina TaxID=2259620 RepID=A0A4P7XGK1_9ALTE|nr:DUF6160 family protein [Hydrocarboniclastica marina]MAL96931.1 hypothetical protein [Alteromonadaceae bacterium]QCF26131.1 hypothetical protein soil367_09415 [Hydrocarboniclastica marina]
MTYLKRKAPLLVAGLLAPLAGHAEFQAMDDSGLRAATGQAGITMDLSANVEIAEVAYKDQGFIFINDLKLGGAGIAQAALGEDVTAGTALDNLRLTLDVAGSNQDDLGAKWGLDKLDGTALTLTEESGDHGVTPVVIEDGDLVISLDAQDHAEGVDFGLVIDAIQLGQSGLAPGEGTNAGTSIVSGLKFKGLLGPTDIVIDEENDTMNINAFFSLEGEVTTDFYIPILLTHKSMTFDLKMHNRRGDDVLVYTAPDGTVHSYAHIQADVGAAENDGGLRVNLTDFSTDMDWMNVGWGNNMPTIGNIYWTDLQVQADLTIYGH